MSVNEKINLYYSNPALNQSRLKTLLKGVDAFKNTVSNSELYYEEVQPFIIGGAVDCLLTCSQSIFDSQYYVDLSPNKPSDTIMSIINYVFDNTPKGTRDVVSLYNLQDKILEAVNKHEYYPGWKEQTRINKVLENSNYFDSLKQAEGKQVLSSEDYNIIKRIEKSLRESDNTKDYFNGNRKVKYQVDIYFTYKGIKCKALLDMIDYDYDNNILTIIDLKTMSGPVSRFPESVRKFRYDIQAAWYVEALKAMNTAPPTIKFMFMVESTTHTGSPTMFEVNEDFINMGKYGRKSLSANGILVKSEIKGFDRLVEDYIYYEKQGWVRDKSIDKKVVKLNWDGIVEDI